MSKIFKTSWSIRHLAKSTQKGYTKCLRILSRKVDLDDPITTERYILCLEITNKYKNNLFSAYQKFYDSNEIPWSRPKNLRNEPYPIKISTEARLNAIISSATPKYAVVYNLSEYGIRPDEISKVTLRDLDLEKGTITVRSSKMGLSRTIQLKRETTDLIRDFISRSRIKDVKHRLFGNPSKIQLHWRQYRARERPSLWRPCG